MVNGSENSSGTPLSKEQIGQVEYLIQQSIRGHHFLFDLETLREVLASSNVASGADVSAELTEEEALCIEGHIENLLRQPTLAEKRAYVDALDPETYAWVVRTYFSMIDNNLLHSKGESEVRH